MPYLSFHEIIEKLIRQSDALSARALDAFRAGQKQRGRQHWEKAVAAYERAERLDKEFTAPAWKS